MRFHPSKRGSHALLAGSLLSGAMLGSGCNTFDDAPRGATSLREVMAPQTTPGQAAEMATDPYSAENRYRGTTLLSSADFGGAGVYIQLYVDGADDPDPSVRAASIRALGRHGDPEHAPLIIRGLADGDDFVRVEAARALQRVHSEDAIEPLIRRIEEANESNIDVRAAAADALGQYRQKSVVLALIGALRDSRLAVNDRVQHSLMTLTGQNFALDRQAWLDWYNRTNDLFAGARPYTYPVFSRKKKIIEYFPLVPPPPNETTSTPVGMDPVLDG
ncbi:MAG: HEAT repeat domain-containing protein [Phycisphaerales bacterium]